MLLGFASLVLGVAAASVTRTIAAARAAGAAAGRAFAAGFGRVRAGMASVSTWFRTTFGRMGTTIGRIGARFSALGARIRALSPSMNSLTRGSLAYTRSLFRMTRAVSSVAGAFQGSNGLWYVMRNGRRVLLTQRHQVTQTLTAWGRFVTRMQQVGESISSNLINKGPLLAGLAGLAVALGPAIGALLVAGIGIGLAGAGIAIAAKYSDKVQKAFRETFQPIGQELKGFAVSAFEGPLIESAARFKQTWKEIGPVVTSALVKSAQFVKPLTDGLAGFIENAIGGGGFSKLIDAAGPIINKLSSLFAMLGRVINDVFKDLAGAGPGLIKGLMALFYTLAGVIRIVVLVIVGLAKAFDVATEAAQWMAEGMANMLGWVPGLGSAWKWVAETLGLFNDEANKSRAIMPIAGTAAAQAAGGLNMTGEAAEKARKALYDLTEKIYGLISAQLGADQAAAAFRRGLMGIADAVKETGTSTQQYTKAGEANIQMVQEMVGLALQARDAAIKLAGGEKASEAAVRAANSAFSAQIAQLEATLRKAGFTQAQIDALLGSYRNLAAAPNISKSVNVTYTTFYKSVGSIPKGERVGPAGSANIAGFASGTLSAPPGFALVGEEGPELMRLKGGERIWPADETAKILAQSKSMAAASSRELGGLDRATPDGTASQAPSVAVKVFIGNEEFKGYVAQVSDERIGASQRGISRKLAGR